MYRNRSRRPGNSGRVSIVAGARSSPLSRAQFEEIQREMGDLDLRPLWVETIGDRDRSTSLRTLGKTDFFTRELDQMLLEGKIDIAIHSAKDLPEPLPPGLCIAALTQGVDPRDSLVLRPGETLTSLQPHAIIATSSLRREEVVRELRQDLRFIDLRGTILERLEKLNDKTAEGVVIAEAALIRLHLTGLNRILLPGETVPLQGRLAVVARIEDEQIRECFRKIHVP